MVYCALINYNKKKKMQQFNKEENDNFNLLFNGYKSITDKHKTLYIFIINHIMVEEVIEKVKRMIIIIDSGTNPSKNAYRKNRVSLFLNFLTGIKPESFVDGVFMLSEKLDKFQFNQYWKETIESFGCAKFIETHEDYFDIEWLRNLFLDRSYINVLQLKNNTLKHTHLSKTKKRLHLERTEKSMDINAYIESNKLLANSGSTTGSSAGTNTGIYIIHGVSSFLRGVITSENIHLLNGDQRDEDILNLIERIDNDKKCQLLKIWLDKMSDEKEGHKLVFGSEIKENIEAQMLQIIFVTPERAEKMLLNFPDYELENKFVIIKTFDSTDLGHQLATQWKGAIGIKYY